MSLFARRTVQRPAFTLPVEGAPDHLSTHFEDWCESQGIHPEKFGAWESFEASRLDHDKPEGE